MTLDSGTWCVCLCSLVRKLTRELENHITRDNGIDAVVPFLVGTAGGVANVWLHLGRGDAMERRMSLCGCQRKTEVLRKPSLTVPSPSRQHESRIALSSGVCRCSGPMHTSGGSAKGSPALCYLRTGDDSVNVGLGWGVLMHRAK